MEELSPERGVERCLGALAWIKAQAENAMALAGGSHGSEEDLAMLLSITSDIAINAEMAEEALTTQAKAQEPDHIPDAGKMVALPRLTERLVKAACMAHYGTDNIHGIDMTASGENFSFDEGFRRMWAGVRKALKTIPAKPSCPLCDGTGHKDHAGFAMDTCDHKGGG